MAQTQEEFFASLNQGSSDGEKLPTLKFLEMNKPQQGVVTEVYPTIERGFKSEPNPVDKNGNPKPLLIVTVEQSDGTKGKIYFKGALLYSLRQVLKEHQLPGLPIGAMVGAAWTSNKPFNGFEAKQYTVQVRVPE